MARSSNPTTSSTHSTYSLTTPPDFSSFTLASESEIPKICLTVLTSSLFSKIKIFSKRKNMAISETKRPGWRTIPTQ